MQQILVTADHELWLSQIHRAADFRSPFKREPFVLLLVSAVSEFDPAERSAICREIIRAGCRYVVCYGNECYSGMTGLMWLIWILALNTPRQRNRS